MSELPKGWTYCRKCGLTYSQRFYTCPKCRDIANGIVYDNSK